MKNKTTVFYCNILLIAANCVVNYFYQSNDNDFTLKCVGSALFVAIGVLNYIYAVKTLGKKDKFYKGMLIALVFCFLGDVFIHTSFVLGAGLFAVGHTFLVYIYCLVQKLTKQDVIISSVPFVGTAIFLLFFPLLRFDIPVFRYVCIAYAVIISLMLGKAIGNYLKDKSTLNLILATAGVLFFFSDVMLVFSWFIGLWSWTFPACMGTYYPALCLLAYSMYVKTQE